MIVNMCQNAIFINWLDELLDQQQQIRFLAIRAADCLEKTVSGHVGIVKAL
ncbi:MAG: hypothetical protein LIP16_11830 [Clostridium sp.]|nr:hypothetical protein [Clostridium sp.]